MSIKDLPINLRPREKCLKLGVNKLSDIELLAIFLRNGTKEMDALDLAKKIFEKAKSFSNLSNFTFYDLKKIKGIGEVKAIEILSFFELIKRMKNPIHNFIKNEKEAINYASRILKNKNREEFLLILLDNKNQVLYHEIVYKGTSISVDVNIFEIVQIAFSLNAKKVYCFHNHPSGDVSPSKNDLEITQKLFFNLKIIGINLLGHYILNSFGQYYKI